MFLTTIYKYELNGIIYVGAEKVPKGATILEEMIILNAEDGYELERIKDKHRVGNSVWLHNGDVESNYREVQIIDAPV